MININRLLSFNIRTILDYRSLSKHIITADGKEVLKEKRKNMITLVSPDNSVSITDLKSAENLSFRRDLKLVKIVDIDVKTKRPVYRLMSPSEYHEEELQHRKLKKEARENSAIKGQKLLTLSARIGEHDLMTSVKKMLKFLEKQYEVRVVITGHLDDMVHHEKVFTVIESNINPLGRVVQKRIKDFNLKFQLLPLRTAKSTPVNADTSIREHDNPKDDKGPL